MVDIPLEEREREGGWISERRLTSTSRRNSLWNDDYHSCSYQKSHSKRRSHLESFTWSIIKSENEKVSLESKAKKERPKELRGRRSDPPLATELNIKGTRPMKKEENPIASD